MIEPLLERFTYVGLLGVLLLAGLGLPIPEEAVVLAAGALAHQQVVRWWLALPVCLVGVVAGDVILYGIGHHWGERVLAWPWVQRFVPPERARTLEEQYRRHGAKVIVAARHVMGLRAAAFLAAGIVRLGFWKFVLVDTATAMVGVSVAFFLAYLFTDHVAEILADVHRVERWLGLLALCAATLFGLALLRRQRRLLEARRDRE